MPFKILSHTADLRMTATGKTIKELFSSALAGMTSYLAPKIPKNLKSVRRTISLASPDRTTLLVDFLNEVLSLSLINKEAYDKIIFKNLADTKIKAEIYGSTVENFGKDIKAVTYHEADVRQNEKGEWETTLVFDI